MKRFPLDGCASATMLAPATRRMVTVFKDRGEERMAGVLAGIMADAMPPSWRERSLLVPIPARKKAKRARGFDHMQMIAGELANATGVPCLGLLQQGQRRDQRELDARQRLQNIAGSIAVKPGKRALIPKRVILVDDVLTTGATLFAAADALRRAGAEEVLGLTFIRA